VFSRTYPIGGYSGQFHELRFLPSRPVQGLRRAPYLARLGSCGSGNASRGGTRFDFLLLERLLACFRILVGVARTWALWRSCRVDGGPKVVWAGEGGCVQCGRMRLVTACVFMSVIGLGGLSAASRLCGRTGVFDSDVLRCGREGKRLGA